eukprot:gene8320-4329_t
MVRYAHSLNFTLANAFYQTDQSMADIPAVRALSDQNPEEPAPLDELHDDKDSILMQGQYRI